MPLPSGLKPYPSHPQGKTFGGIDYLKITILVFALSALWQGMHTIILPSRIQDIAPEGFKNTYLGIMTAVGLVLAMATQPVAGVMSDYSRIGWGRRRPYILLGSTLVILLLPGVGLFSTYAGIFAVYCLLQVASNLSQGAHQGLLPDLVPPANRGRASAIKTILETAGGAAGVVLISQFMDRYIVGEGSSWLWAAISIPAVLVLILAAITLLTVSEPPHPQRGLRPSIKDILLSTFKVDLKMSPGLVWFLVSRVLVFMAFTALQQFALYLLQDFIGVENAATATAHFTVATVAGILIAVYPAGYAADKVGRRPLVMGSALTGAAGIAVILFFRAYPALLAAAAIIGVSLGTFFSSSWALATDMVAPGEEAKYLGITNMATTGGGALARLIGPVIDFFNLRVINLGYVVMLVICLMCFAVGGLLITRVPKN